MAARGKFKVTETDKRQLTDCPLLLYHLMVRQWTAYRLRYPLDPNSNPSPPASRLFDNDGRSERPELVGQLVQRHKEAANHGIWPPVPQRPQHLRSIYSRFRLFRPVEPSVQVGNSGKRQLREPGPVQPVQSR